MNTRIPKWRLGFQGLACIVLTAVLAGSSVVTAGLPAAPDRACRPQMTDTADIGVVADWMKSLQYTDKSLQYTDAALTSYGAIKVHHTPGFASYYRVNPYRANLGVLGLLRAPVDGKLTVAERWLTWYLDHLRTDGAILDHWYLADGTGETTCLLAADPALCNFEDAADSYAATLLSVAWAYYEAGGSATFLDAPGNKAKFEAIAGVILALQAEDGLTVAKPSYPAKFLMDNSEVHHGLRAIARLEEAIFGDNAAAQKYSETEAKVQRGIERSLFNRDRGLYRVAKFDNGAFQEADLSQWYPGTVALVWPHLFGVTAGHSQRAQSQMAAVNARWDWTASVEDPAGFLWPSIGYAALLTGDCAGARAHVDFVKAQRFPDFTYPFTVDDGGWLLMTLSQLAR